MMFKTILSYAASNGVQRAISFLASLLLLRVYTPAEVGEYILIQTIAQLLIPLTTLNVTVALTREAKVDIFRTVDLLKRISIAVLGLFTLMSLVLVFAGAWRWICAAVMLGLAEALYSALTAFLMGRENSTKVLKISVIRVVVFCTFLVCTYQKYLSITQFVILVAAFLVGLSLVVIWSIVRRVQNNARLRANSHVTIATMYGYSVRTLPHTAALWCSVSSDRAMLGFLHGKEAIGEYAVASTLAQAVMVLLAGVISAVPPRIINETEIWLNPTIIIRFIRKIAFLTMLIITFSLALFFVNYKYIGFVPNSVGSDLITLSLIGSSYFFSFIYVFFASYLYKMRDTKAQTYTGIFLLPINIGIFYILVYFFGKTGAAIGLLLSYMNFGVSYGVAAVRLVPELRSALLPIVWISFIQIMGSLSVAYLFLLLAH